MNEVSHNIYEAKEKLYFEKSIKIIKILDAALLSMITRDRRENMISKIKVVENNENFKEFKLLDCLKPCYIKPKVGIKHWIIQIKYISGKRIVKYSLDEVKKEYDSKIKVFSDSALCFWPCINETFDEVEVGFFKLKIAIIDKIKEKIVELKNHTEELNDIGILEENRSFKDRFS